MNTRINELLTEMPPVTLDEITNLRLMERMDSKYVVSALFLPRLLEEMKPLFRVQVISGAYIAAYRTQYMDTHALDMFLMHHNGKLNRQKVRIRSYVESGLSFLEIKNKNNKGRTSKWRIPVHSSPLLSMSDLADAQPFLNANAMFRSEDMSPALSSHFRRMTFVNRKATERITVDIRLSFLNHRTGRRASPEQLMILELKQDGRQCSDFRNILHRARIKPVSFSKYCMGTVLTDPHAKYNRFKSKLNTLSVFFRY
ncbi:MAG: polyphosphate polymerase domain-containing protein [Bacteroidales bacterium]|jgi:hypothetical protein|nr:polyphosphate polymerase domain-containing protein [Bacteroidales bacterium]